jgi:hypothetical protein
MKYNTCDRSDARKFCVGTYSACGKTKEKFVKWHKGKIRVAVITSILVRYQIMIFNNRSSVGGE